MIILVVRFLGYDKVAFKLISNKSKAGLFVATVFDIGKELTSFSKSDCLVGQHKLKQIN